MGCCCSTNSSNYERVPLNSDLDELNASRRASGLSHARRNVKDEVELAAKFFLRSKPGLVLERRCDGIGNRARKEFFTVKSQTGTGSSSYLLMTMVEKPKECAIPLETENGRYALEQILTGIRSHFVYPTVGVDFVEEKKLVVVFRELQSKGSLRDLLFQSKWSKSYEEKYTTKKV